VCRHYCLVYWDPNLSRCKFGALSASSAVSRNGYLYVRHFYPNGWLRRSSDWLQSFFILQCARALRPAPSQLSSRRGRKLYQFEDMSCKVGTRIFSLQWVSVGGVCQAWLTVLRFQGRGDLLPPDRDARAHVLRRAEPGRLVQHGAAGLPDAPRAAAVAVRLLQQLLAGRELRRLSAGRDETRARAGHGGQLVLVPRLLRGAHRRLPAARPGDVVDRLHPHAGHEPAGRAGRPPGVPPRQRARHGASGRLACPRAHQLVVQSVAPTSSSENEECWLLSFVGPTELEAFLGALQVQKFRVRLGARHSPLVSAAASRLLVCGRG